MEKETLFYQEVPKKTHKKYPNKYQLVLCAGNISLVLGTFDQLEELKEVVKKYFPGTQLAKLSQFRPPEKKQPAVEFDNVYLPLQGEAPRNLSWGMSRKKVTRLEQIEGAENMLMKVEYLHGYQTFIQFGFHEWAHCGLEYIAYSSPEGDFLDFMQEELNQTYGTAEEVVDYHRLDRLLQEGAIKNEETLIRFIKDPESPSFNRFITRLRGLTFRSARKWCKDHTCCLMYRKRSDCLGERNRHNHLHVVEFWPSLLFDFYQEQFAELYLPV